MKHNTIDSVDVLCVGFGLVALIIFGIVGILAMTVSKVPQNCEQCSYCSCEGTIAEEYSIN